VNSSVSHDCRVGAYVTLSPGAVVCGTVTIGNGAYVGANACIIQGLEIDERAVVGAGAVVTRNVAADLTVVGVPARPLRNSALLESNRRP
jgi:UDP-perosamine 4-acetyltransferase